MIYRAEAVVTGGGPAGICGALALARQGRKTVLITNRPVLGGNSSSEIRVWTRGATGAGNLYAEEMGIWGELKLRNLYLNPEANPVFWDDVLLEQTLQEENITLFLNTHVSEVKMKEDGTIRSVSGSQMGTEKNIEFEGQIFIDATGDGTIGQLAGVPSAMGKEERQKYGESLAPLEPEKTTFGNTIFFFTQNAGKPVEYKAPDFAYSIEQIEGMLGRGGRIVNEQMNGCDYWWFEMGGMQNTIDDAQEIGLELKRLVAGVWNYIKNSGRFKADQLTLSWEGNLPGKRESRRMVTETILCQQDVLGPADLPDSAFYGGWYLDFHPSDGINTEEENCIQIPVQIYPVPLGCLYNKKVGNLIFAGRNIGVSHVAFASTRIMNTCALSGQAAGSLAAKCLELKRRPGDLDREAVKDIQQRLLDNDMLIPGVDFDRTRNLAGNAAVQVSSEENAGSAEEDGCWDLAEGGFLVWPKAAGRAEVLFRTEEKTELFYEIYESCLPSRAAYGKKTGQGSLKLEPGRQWISLEEMDKEGEGFATAVFQKAAGVKIIAGREELPGFLMGHKDWADYKNPYIRLNSSLYNGENLINNRARLWKSPNLWISQKEKSPWAELTFKEKIQVREILVFFNPDLNKELVSSRADSWDDHHKYVPRAGMPPQLVRSAALYARGSGVWEKLGEISDNWKRRWQVKLPEPVEISGLRLEITSDYGQGRAEVFEIRVY